MMQSSNQERHQEEKDVDLDLQVCRNPSSKRLIRETEAPSMESVAQVFLWFPKDMSFLSRRICHQ